MPELGFEPGLQSLGDVSEKSKSQKKNVLNLTICQIKRMEFKKKMPGPGFVPRLQRPQRSVLTTRRSRLTILTTAGRETKIMSLTSNNGIWIL